MSPIHNLFLQFLYASLTGTLLVLFILVLRRICGERFSRKWQYYTCLIVVLRLLLPFGLPLPQFARQSQEPAAAVQPIAEVAESVGHVSNTATYITDAYQRPLQPLLTQTPQTSGIPKIPSIISAAFEYMWMAWLGIALLVFSFKIYHYHIFIRTIRSTATVIEDEAIQSIYDEARNSTHVKRRLPIYTGCAVSSPTLVGFTKPFIVLPNTFINSQISLRYIFIHELIHFKRMDIGYKWLVQIALCLHWFNPVFYLFSRQVNRLCELSCDETAIKGLAGAERRAYGDMLIRSIEMRAFSGRTPLTATLAENTKNMKERLGSIMSYHKKSKFTHLISLSITAVLTIGAVFTGFKSDLYGKGETAIPAVIDSSCEILTYGSYSLKTTDRVTAKINWVGSGNVMFLYTKENLEMVQKLLKKGVLPIDMGNNMNLSSDFSYTDMKKTSMLCFTMKSNGPIDWTNAVPSDGQYNFYVIAENKADANGIRGTITAGDTTLTIEKGNYSAANTITKAPEKLENMTSWMGTNSETKTDNGVAVNSTNWTGDKYIYEFIGDGSSKQFTLTSNLKGEFEVVYVTEDRTILHRLDTFIGEKTFEGFADYNGKISVALVCHNVTGQFTIN